MAGFFYRLPCFPRYRRLQWTITEKLMGINILGYTSKSDPNQKRQFITHWKFRQARRPKVLLILNPVFVSWDYIFLLKPSTQTVVSSNPRNRTRLHDETPSTFAGQKEPCNFRANQEAQAAVLGPKKRPDLPTVQSPDFVRARWVAFIYLFIYLSIDLSVCLPVYPSIHPFTYT